MSTKVTSALVGATADSPQAGTNNPFLFALTHKYLSAITLGLILILTCAAYCPAFHGTILWDDDAYLTTPELSSWTGLRRIWFDLSATPQYYPLFHTAFWIEHRMWGDWLPGYHLVTLAWHLFAVVLLYLVLRKLRIPGALFAAAIFAVHPVAVESVAWVSEQKNTLSTAFYLGAMLTYLTFDQARERRHYAFALALFVLGLTTKTAIVTFPVALIVIFWWQRGCIAWRRDLVPLLPFFLLALLAGLGTIWVEYYHVGASSDRHALSAVDRFLLAGRSLWFYAQKLAWPTNLTFNYPGGRSTRETRGNGCIRWPPSA